jgi:hypothetical protein
MWRDPEGFGATMAAVQGLGHEEVLAAVPEQVGLASDRITEPDEVAARSAHRC